MATVGRGAEQYTVRFPDGLRDRIKAAADTNNRSMNAEIVARLEASLSDIPPLDEDMVRIIVDRTIDNMLRDGVKWPVKGSEQGKA